MDPRDKEMLGRKARRVAEAMAYVKRQYAVAAEREEEEGNKEEAEVCEEAVRTYAAISASWVEFARYLEEDV